jgi:hypothetical protein
MQFNRKRTENKIELLVEKLYSYQIKIKFLADFTARCPLCGKFPFITLLGPEAVDYLYLCDVKCC